MIHPALLLNISLSSVNCPLTNIPAYLFMLSVTKKKDLKLNGLPAKSDISGKVRSYPSAAQMNPYRVGSRSWPQLLGLAGNASQGQTL